MLARREVGAWVRLIPPLVVIGGGAAGLWSVMRARAAFEAAAGADASRKASHGGFGFSGRWRCGADLGQSSLAASSFDPDLHDLGAIRLWRQPSEPDVQIWERQDLRLEYQ